MKAKKKKKPVKKKGIDFGNHSVASFINGW